MSKEPNIFEQFIADSEEETATIDELGQISVLAKEQQKWETEVAKKENELYLAKENLKRVQEFLLPEAMKAVGMVSFKMDNGAKITIKEDVYASIRADKKDAAFEWMAEHDLDGIIKDQVSVNFGKGETERAKELLELCQQNGFEASEALSVHPSTFKAAVKREMERGVQFPDELFSIVPGRKAIIK